MGFSHCLIFEPSGIVITAVDDTDVAVLKAIACRRPHAPLLKTVFIAGDLMPKPPVTFQVHMPDGREGHLGFLLAAVQKGEQQYE
jgi:hypothetical protein